MANLLLIGFTETNANVIQIFIEMTFKDIYVDTIIRHLNDSPLSLPVLTEEHHKNDVFIIDFEGAGLDLSDKNIAKNLEIYTRGKPILFVSRQNSVVPVSLVEYEWLTVPYNRQQMTERVKKVLSNVTVQPLKPNTYEPNIQKPPVATQKPPKEEPVIDVNTTANISPVKANNDDIKAIFDVLIRAFPEINEQQFFHFIKRLQSVNAFNSVTINNYQMYLNPIDKSIITASLERISDNFMVGAGVRNENIVFVQMDASSFRQKTASQLAAGAKQYTLAQVVWFIGLEMMQVNRNAFGQSHHLKFEARYMPNFAGIKFTPNYLTLLIASCLGRARSLVDFGTLFPQLTNAQVNQILILLAMSNNINKDILVQSANATTASTVANKVDTTNNTGIQKAQKTGFLKRLLSRLGV